MANSSTTESPWPTPPPVHFDSAWPRWAKFLVVLAFMFSAFLYDKPFEQWCAHHQIAIKSDVQLEMIMLMQWGGWSSSILIILTVALLDRYGRRKALAIALGCLATVAVCYLLKDLFGRARPWELGRDIYGFFGPAEGFHSSAYQSFPSSHTTGAFALSAGLAWFYPRARSLFYLLALQVALQRLWRLDHYPSDAIAGALVAVTVVRSVLMWNWPGKLIAALPLPWRRWLLAENREPTIS
ncbi:MAG TPA: phosphatase PAP2 family protein [Phycisphaerae bacterium]|nr:phosphatase PAP2 family protein [Phycisphaerae bacterium]